MAKCDLMTRKGRNKLALSEELPQFAKVLAMMSSDQVSVSSMRLKEVYENRQDVFKALLGPDTTVKEVADLEQRFQDNPALISAFYDKYDRLAKEIISLSNNPRETMASLDRRTRAYSIMKQSTILNKVNTTLSFAYNKALGIFGIDGTSSEYFQVVGNKMPKLEQFIPAKHAFELHQRIDNFTNIFAKEVVDKTEEAYYRIFTPDFQKRFNLKSNQDISTVIAFFDKGYREELYGAIGTDFDRDDVSSSFRQHVEDKLNANMEETDLKSLFNTTKSFMNEWNMINYGRDVTDEDLSDATTRRALISSAPKGTMMYFIHGVQEYTREMKAMVDQFPGKINPDFVRNIENITRIFDEFTPRKDYVPLRSNDMDFMSNALSRSLEQEGDYENIHLAASWSRRQEDGDYNSLTIDFMDNLNHIAVTSNLMLKDLSYAFLSAYLKGAKDSATEDGWFKQNYARQEVKYNIEQAINAADRMYSSDRIKNNKVKNIITAAGIIPASILSMPQSSIKNRLEGMFQMLIRLGGDLHGSHYHNAKATNTMAYSMIHDVAEKELITSGIIREFMENAPMVDKLEGDWADKTTEYIRNKSMKGADFIGNLYGVGRRSVSHTLHNNFTMEGSERTMRENSTKLLYNRIHQEALLRGKSIDTLTKAEVAHLIKIHKADVFYDIGNALGNFHPLNKPFSYHLLRDTADTQTKVLAGAVLNWSYMFRHAGIVTAENFAHSATKMFSDKIMGLDVGPKVNPREKVIATGAMGGILAAILYSAWDYIRDAVNTAADEERDPLMREQHSWLRVLTPLEEIEILPRSATYLMVLPFFNGKMSERMYEEFKEMAIDHTLGILGDGVKDHFDIGRYVDTRVLDDILQEGSPNNLFEAIIDWEKIRVRGESEPEMLANMKAYYFKEKQKGINKQGAMLKPIDVVNRLLTSMAVSSDNKTVDAHFKAELLWNDFIFRAFIPKLWFNRRIDYNYESDFQYAKSLRGNQMKLDRTLARYRNKNQVLGTAGLGSGQTFSALGHYMATGREMYSTYDQPIKVMKPMKAIEIKGIKQ